MKRFFTKFGFVALLLLVSCVVVFAQDVAPVDSTEVVTEAVEAVDVAATESGSNWGAGVLDILISIISGVAFLFMIGHMLYVKFMLSPRFKQKYDVEFFKQQRIAIGMSEESTEDENAQIANIIDQAHASWAVKIDPTTGEEEYLPTKMIHIKEAILKVDETVALAPTDPDIIEALNELTECINVNEKRHFDGSKILIWIALGFGVIIGLAATWSAMIPMVMGCAIYYLASNRPTFLLAKQRDGKVGIINGIIIWALGMIGAAQTVRTTTKWSDGSESVDDDHTEHWVAWIFAIIIIVTLAFTIIIWSIFNYLRNYVFYV